MTEQTDTEQTAALMLRGVLAQYATPDKSVISALVKEWRDRDTGRTKSMSLDYVGHAEITRILIEIDPMWTWQPIAWHDGRPAINISNGVATMWATLTLLGKPMLGVGSAQASKPDLDKELIGDFLRNASMRFGICLALWAKSDWAEPHIESTDDAAARRADGEAAYEKIKPQQRSEHPATLRRAAAIQAATDADAPPVEQTQAEKVLAAFAGSTVAPAAQPSGNKVVQLRVAASEKQIATIGKIAKERNIDDITGYCSTIIGRQIDDIGTLVAREASAILKAMIGK